MYQRVTYHFTPCHETKLDHAVHHIRRITFHQKQISTGKAEDNACQLELVVNQIY